MRTGWSWDWERLLFFKPGCRSNTMVELHNTKKLSVFVQPSKTGLFLCSRGTRRPEREQDHSVCPPLFMDSEQTPPIVSPDLCLVCVIRGLSLSSSCVVVNCIGSIWLWLRTVKNSLTSFWMNLLTYISHPCRAVLVGFLTLCTQACKRRSRPLPECTGTYFQPQLLNLWPSHATLGQHRPAQSKQKHIPFGHSLNQSALKIRFE